MKTGTESNLKILEAQLFMNDIPVNPSILLAHHHVLQTKNALYPFSKVEVKSLTIYLGNNTMSIDKAVIGQIPNFLAFCMVKNRSYSGHRVLDPFQFKHFKTNALTYWLMKFKFLPRLWSSITRTLKRFKAPEVKICILDHVELNITIVDYKLPRKCSIQTVLY